MTKGKGKKKPSSKQKEKEEAAAKKRQEEVDQAAEEDDTEFQKALLEIRVKELEQLKVGMQRKCEFLETQNELYKTQFDEMKEEKDDIIAHLRKCYSEGTTTVKELEDRLCGTQKAREDEAKDFLKQLAEKDRETLNVEERLGKTIQELSKNFEAKIHLFEKSRRYARLATLEDFRLQRENLLYEKEKLKQKLEDERKSFHDEFDNLENRTIIYKEKLRKEAVEMLVKMSKDVQKAGKLCLTATVKSAIQSNIKLQNEIESTSKDNILLRKKLEKLNDLLREKRMTIEVIEEESTAAHKKCMEYKEIVLKLIDKQLTAELELKSMSKFQADLHQLEVIHGECRTDEEIGRFVIVEVEKILEKQRQLDVKKEILSPEDVKDLQIEVERLRDIIVKLAIAAKTLAQAVSHEEQDYYKSELKTLLKKAYAISLEIPDLTPEVVELLTIPNVSAVVKKINYS